MLLKKQNREDGICPGNVRVLQGLCWGTLFLVQLFFIHCLETPAASEGENSIQVYEFRLIQIPAEEILVERDVVYEAVEALTRVPEFVKFAVEEDGRQAQVSCWSDDMTMKNARWTEGFSFPVTFHGCDAEYCQLGDALIPYREDRPELNGYEPLLLELIGAPQEAYRVTDIAWSGGIYTDAAGTLCRDALAIGEKMVQDVEVHYVGTAEFPACEQWQMAAAYELPMPEAHVMAGEIEPSGAGDEHLRASDAESEFWKWAVRTVTAAFSLFLLLLLVILVAKRKKIGYTKRDCENEDRRVEK